MRQLSPASKTVGWVLMAMCVAIPGTAVMAEGGEEPGAEPGAEPGMEPGLELPLGLPSVLPVPEDNPLSSARTELGRRLFFDPILSADRTVSCSSCHRPELGFADDRPLSLGVGGKVGLRNAPGLFNRGFGRHFMWDGRFDSLEAQVVEPIGNELELALGVPAALERLGEDEEYRQAFGAAFEDGLNETNLAKALAAFVRGLTLGDSPVDRFRELGEHAALTPSQRTGLWIYESKGGCWKCHSGPNFTDESFHNTGVGAVDGLPLPGRAAITADAADRGGFKTPTLRGVALTAPYMHDGSLGTLAEVVDFYRRGGGANEQLDEQLRPIELSDEEAAALVDFLEVLSERAAE